MGQYTQGVMWVSFGALMWAVYALLQKLLLRHFTSVQLMMFINLLGALIFFGLATPTQLFLLNERQAWLLAFCCLNTVFAYGAFAEALVHWEASKVSAVLALAPLITIATLDGLSWYRPDLYQSVHLNVLAVLGAFLVIGGSATAALTKRAVKLYPTSLETPQYDKRQPEAE